MSETKDGDGAPLGECCEAMREIVGAKEFESLIALGDDGVLYMSIGIADAEEGESSVIEHPVFFCPFCGVEVQTEEQVEAKTGQDGEA